ncbi:unnamed protein product [Zymoseptoria tritici ST99CH_1A5]|uniref:Uncharacterized protein n=1 Tax=Zymoseptoria tritici ST99CH_1A5 TaxID=1276529 RepID=A0A1Y6LRK2_ZYMTR|nr:unnamed protein product [Zymoseptoria tritici ST99CH_1A5]
MRGLCLSLSRGQKQWLSNIPHGLQNAPIPSPAWAPTWYRGFHTTPRCKVGSPWAQKESDLAVQLMKEGKSNNQISRHLPGRTERGVMKHLIRYQKDCQTSPEHRRNRVFTKEIIEKVLAARDAGISISQIALMYKDTFTERQIRNRLAWEQRKASHVADEAAAERRRERRAYSESEDCNIVEWREELHLSWVEIARRLGRPSGRGVQNRYYALRPDALRRGSPLNEGLLERIKELHGEGLSSPEIARRLNVALPDVRGWVGQMRKARGGDRTTSWNLLPLELMCRTGIGAQQPTEPARKADVLPGLLP